MPEFSQDPFDAIPLHEPVLDPQALSDIQLRQLYDEEEVERFMSLFAAYVPEVRLSAGAASTEPKEPHTPDISAEGRPQNGPILPPCPTYHSLSEHIAYNYLLPYLPPATRVTPTFTLKRLSLTAQRLYLALFPHYQAFLSDLAHLALWGDYQRSLRYCITFWFLWFYDLLLSAFIFRIAFGLLRHRMSTYPTSKELQERRQEAARALKFGEALQQQLSITTLGLVEIWRLFKLYKSEGKDKAKFAMKDTNENDQEENFKRNMLYALDELADFHERVKNIFTWRRPNVSRRYLFFFLIIGFGTLVIPAQYVAKLICGFGGILFWHVTPVVAALPQADRIRVSLLFRDAPTDFDCAMEVIAKRLSTGQDAGKVSPNSQSRRTSNASAVDMHLSNTLYDTSREAQSSQADGINWKKWGERVARGKAFLEEGKQLLSIQNSRDPVSGEVAAISRPVTGDAHTFPAQYASRPGLITLTSSTLLFTSLTGTHARLVVPRDRLRGVRRSGLMKGISITWAPEQTTDGKEKEERFHWVGNRDELFARLVGSDSGHWVRV